jgi:RimJ/RimL family protein N-acetyltransferase
VSIVGAKSQEIGLAPTYPIATERLHLRPLDPATDVDAVHAYQSREDVCRYIPYFPRTREQIAERLADPERTRSTFDKEGQVISLAMVLRETNQLVGDVVLMWHSAEHQGGEIGYVINPDFQGNGYVTEACGALLDLAFDALKLHRVVARIDQRNAASASVARRLGMRQEAVLVENEWFKGEWTTEIDFAILAAEWQTRSAALR